jgi:hypothetical protein
VIEAQTEDYNFYHKMPKETAVSTVIEKMLDFYENAFYVTFEDGVISIYAECDDPAANKTTGIRERIGSGIGGWYFVIFRVGEGYVKQFKEKG